MKIIATLILIILFSSCGGVKLEQEISKASCIEGTTYINTRVWVNNFIGFPITLEYTNQVCVKTAYVDSIKRLEYIKATPSYELAKNCK